MLPGMNGTRSDGKDAQGLPVGPEGWPRPGEEDILALPTVADIREAMDGHLMAAMEPIPPAREMTYLADFFRDEAANFDRLERNNTRRGEADAVLYYRRRAAVCRRIAERLAPTGLWPR